MITLTYLSEITRCCGCFLRYSTLMKLSFFILFAFLISFCEAQQGKFSLYSNFLYSPANIKTLNFLSAIEKKAIKKAIDINTDKDTNIIIFQGNDNAWIVPILSRDCNRFYSPENFNSTNTYLISLLFSSNLDTITIIGLNELVKNKFESPATTIKPPIDPLLRIPLSCYIHFLNKDTTNIINKILVESLCSHFELSEISENNFEYRLEVKPDSSLLYQVNFYDFIDEIESITSFTDSNGFENLTKNDFYLLTSMPTQVNIFGIDTIIKVKAKPKMLYIHENWVVVSSNFKLSDHLEIKPFITIKRSFSKIEIMYENGNSIFYNFNDAITHLKKIEYDTNAHMEVIKSYFMSIQKIKKI
jgi:hypothetical protein